MDAGCDKRTSKIKNAMRRKFKREEISHSSYESMEWKIAWGEEN